MVTWQAKHGDATVLADCVGIGKCGTQDVNDNLTAMSPVGGFCCKSLFAPPTKNFPGCRRGDRILMWGTTASCDELTGDFGSTFEATSIGDRSLFPPFAEN